MSETAASSIPVPQQDHEPETMLDETAIYILQIKDDEDGRWRDFLTPRTDRDDLTLIQADRARRFPGERRRVLTRVTYLWVSEVEGDGEGETSREALFARNDEITERLMKKSQQGNA